MPIDPEIPLSGRTQVVNPLESYHMLMGIKAQQQQMDIQKQAAETMNQDRLAQVAERQQQVQLRGQQLKSQQVVDGLMSNSMVQDETTGAWTLDRAKFEAALVQSNNGHRLPELSESLDKMDESTRKASSAKRQTIADAFVAVHKAGNTPGALQTAAAVLQKNNLIDASHAQPLLDAVDQGATPDQIGQMLQHIGQGMPEYQAALEREDKRKTDAAKTQADIAHVQAETVKALRPDKGALEKIPDYDEKGNPIWKWVAPNESATATRVEPPTPLTTLAPGAIAVNRDGQTVATGNPPAARPTPPVGVMPVDTVNEAGQPVTRIVDRTAGQEFVKPAPSASRTQPREVKPGSEEAFFIAYAKKLGKRPDDLSLEDQGKARQAWARADDKAPSTADDAGLKLTPAGRDAAARNYAVTGQLPPMGMGKEAAATKAAIVNRAAELYPDLDLAANSADYRSNRGSLVKMQAQRDAIGAFEQTAGKNIDIFLKEAGKVIDTGSPMANTVARLVSGKMLGSADQAGYDAARQVAISEIAKITSNPNLSGSLSDSARHEVDAFNPREATLKQTVEVMRILKQDMGNRTIALDKQLADIRGRIKGGSGSSTTPDKPAPASPGGLFSYQDYLKAKGGK